MSAQTNPAVNYIDNELFKKDSAEIKCRIKVLTDGLDDAADPCTPIEVQLPNGKTVWALYFSGGRVIHYSSLDELLKGGVRKFHKIKVLTKDGQPLIMEPFHQAEAIWDTELVAIKDGESVRYVGHGGMMERVSADVPCSVAHHNFRRSRHAFAVEFKVDPLTEQISETWKDLGCVHGNRPTADCRWIIRGEDHSHAHGYGSRMIRDEGGKIWHDTEGFPWMAYEEVTEESVRADGSRIPYGTKIFARKMNHDLTLAISAPVLLSDYSPWDNLEKPFAAAKRKDCHGNPSGFLVEGPNPILMKIGTKEYWVILFSAGDFVAEYGNFMMFREKSSGPIGPYQHLTDENKELIDITAKVAAQLDLTWTGRLNPFYDGHGNLWGLMHGIFKSDIPDGWVKSGWPRTMDEFIGYARRTILVPLDASLRDSAPYLRIPDQQFPMPTEFETALLA